MADSGTKQSPSQKRRESNNSSNTGTQKNGNNAKNKVKKPIAKIDIFQQNSSVHNDYPVINKAKTLSITVNNDDPQTPTKKNLKTKKKAISPSNISNESDTTHPTNSNNNNNNNASTKKKYPRKTKRTAFGNKSLIMYDKNTTKKSKLVYTVCVGNVPKEKLNQTDITSKFENCGNILDLQIFEDKKYCFIDFGSIDEYLSALKLHHSTFDDDNRKIIVKGYYVIPSLKPAIASRHLSIANLPLTVTEEQLLEFLQPCGEVEQIQFLKDKITGFPQGKAIVLMKNISSAQKVISLGNIFMDREIIVEFQTPRFDKSMEMGKEGKFSIVDENLRRRSNLKRELRKSLNYIFQLENSVEQNDEILKLHNTVRMEELEKEREKERMRNGGIKTKF